MRLHALTSETTAPTAPAGTMARSELPWAVYWLKPVSSTMATTMMEPPPIPIIPERNPVNTPTISKTAASPQPEVAWGRKERWDR